MRIGEYGTEEILALRDLSLKGAARRLAIKEVAERLNVSEGHVYRLLKNIEITDVRKVRKDAGCHRIEITPEMEAFMEGLTLQGDFSGEHVLFLAARHFGVKPDFMSKETYNTWLRQKRISRRENRQDLRPYREHLWRDRANALHQYDTTVASAFYANNDGSIGHEPEYKRYKNKPGNRRPRLHLYSLVDYYSSVIFARFYFSENSLNLLDFVFRAWSQKDDPCFPFFGIPEDFYCDHGSPRKSAKFVNTSKTLEFKILDTDPAHWTEHGSRKFGRDERTFGEGLLKELMKTTKIFRYASIDELNDTLWHYLIRLNNKVHRAYGESRFARWLRTVGTPRAMPSEEMFKLMHYDRDERTVERNLQIRLNGKTFQLPYRKPFINWVGAKIECYWYPGHEDVISVVYDFHEEEIRALAPVVELGSRYQNLPVTDREQLVERLKEERYSTINFPEIYRADKSLPYLPRKSEEFDEKRIAEKAVETSDGWKPSFAHERWFSFIAALLECKARDFFPSEEQISESNRDWLRGLMAGREKISETELVAAIDAASAERKVAGDE